MGRGLNPSWIIIVRSFKSLVAKGLELFCYFNLALLLVTYNLSILYFTICIYALSISVINKSRGTKPEILTLSLSSASGPDCFITNKEIMLKLGRGCEVNFLYYRINELNSRLYFWRKCF